MEIVDTMIRTDEGGSGRPVGRPLDKSGERVRRMFASIADKYDLMNHLLSFQVDRYWRRQVVQSVPPENDAQILDVCTGTGSVAIEFSNREHW